MIPCGNGDGCPGDAGDTLAVFDSIRRGTRRVLDLARRSGARRFLLTSTGAVYRQAASPRVTHISEEYVGAPDPTNPAEGRRPKPNEPRRCCARFTRNAQLQPRIARCFGVSSVLPAVDHSPRRRQLHPRRTPRRSRSPSREMVPRIGRISTPGDLAVWLWTVLLRGEPMRPYNVGSEEVISIGDLAHAVARRFSPQAEVRFAMTPASGTPADRYVPSTARIQKELGVTATVDLDEALARTANWHRDRDAMSHVVN